MPKNTFKPLHPPIKGLAYTLCLLTFWQLLTAAAFAQDPAHTTFSEPVTPSLILWGEALVSSDNPNRLFQAALRLMISLACLGLCVSFSVLSAVRWHLASRKSRHVSFFTVFFALVSLACLWLPFSKTLSDLLSPSYALLGYLGIYTSARFLQTAPGSILPMIDQMQTLNSVRKMTFVAFLCVLYFHDTSYQIHGFLGFLSLMLVYAILRSYRLIANHELEPTFSFFSAGFAAFVLQSWQSVNLPGAAYSFPALGLSLDIALSLPHVLQDTKTRLTRGEKIESKLSRLHDLSYLQRVIIHDIAGPLNVIMMSKNLLSASAKQSSKALLYKIESASELIKDIIDFMRLTEKPSSLTPPLKILPLKPLIDEVAEYFHDHLKNKDLDLTLDIETDLTVLSYKPALKVQLLHNVMSNAIKFSGKSGQVKIKAASAEDLCIITITNLGEPIEPRLIQALNQQHCVPSKPGSASEKGLGYGLGIAMQTASLLRGRILISQYQSHDESENGTSVEIQLPRQQSYHDSLMSKIQTPYVDAKA